MSRAAKVFFGGSVITTGFVVWGVHWIQKRESDVRWVDLSLESISWRIMPHPDTFICIIPPLEDLTRPPYT